MTNFDRIINSLNEEIDKAVRRFADHLITNLSISRDEMNSALESFKEDITTNKKTAVSRPRKQTTASEKKTQTPCAGVTAKTGKACGYAGKEEVNGKMYCTTHAKRIKNSNLQVDEIVKASKKKDKSESVEQKKTKLDSYIESISANKVKKNEKGWLVHTEHGFVFDENDRTKVVAVVHNGKKVALSELEKATCEEMGWEVEKKNNIPLRSDENGEGAEGESDSGEEENDIDVGSDVDIDIGDERN